MPRPSLTPGWLIRCCAALAFAFPAATAGAAPVLSEVVASNDGSIVDEDGDASDWFEIFNPDPLPADLSGWHLTDDPDDLSRWTIPGGTVLAPGAFLRVWASGKDRVSAAGDLHTDFSLSADGEFLALVPPGSGSPASSFEFPALDEGESWGPAFVSTTLIAEDATASLLAPAADTAGWTLPAFAPGAGWTTGPVPAGFGMPADGFFVEERQSATPIGSLDDALAVLDGTGATDRLTALRPVVNFVGAGASDARFAGGSPFLHEGAPANIVVRATATITLPAGGQWTFHVHSRDGFRLLFDGATLMEYAGTREPADSFNTRTLTSGDHELQLIWFGGSGANAVELSAAQGRQTTFSTGFSLVGDTDNGPIAAAAPSDSGVSNVATDLSAMQGAGASAFVRLPFALDDPAAVEILRLSIAYNDGFIAYVNGQEVARRNAPAGATHQSAATATRTQRQSLEPETLDLSAFRSLLAAGDNVLAIHLLNAAANDSSLYLAPKLTALGRVPGGEMRYFQQTTPGFPNTSAGVSGHAATPTVSPERGFYESPIQVSLTTATPGAEIRYTTDGSAPGPLNGTVYTGPIAIAGTTPLRAAAFLDDYEASPPVSHTYLFPADIIRQGTSGPGAPWPAAGAINGQVIQYGMDPAIVDHSNASIGGPAATIAALRALPTVCLTVNVADLFDSATGIYVNAEAHGREWERPANIELFADDSGEGFTAGCGIRMRGGVSRRDSNPKHGWRVFFRREYGPGKLRYPIYGDEGTDVFDAFDIQCAQNYSWSRDGNTSYNALREIWSRDTQLAMGQPSTHGRFVHLYINGIYWGMHQIQERSISGWAESYLGGDADNYDVIKHAGLDDGHRVEATDGYFTTLPDGTDSAWKRLWTASRACYFIQNDRDPAAPSVSRTYSQQEKLAAYYKLQGLQADGRTPTGDAPLLDVDNLIDYMILLVFTKNSDSSVSAFYGNERPNNFYCVRDRLGFRGFISINHDAEHTLDASGAADRWGPFASPTGAYWNNIVYSNPQYIHQDLAVGGEYKMRFADRIYRHFFNGGALETAANRERFDRRSSEIEPAIIAESARWGDAQANPARTVANWRSARNATRSWFGSRNAQFLSQARSRGFHPALLPPVAGTRGGIVDRGAVVTLANPNASGTIYFTVNGYDPRPAGGGAAPAPGSLTGSSLTIDRPVTLKARILDGETWSALEELTFGFGTVPAAAGNLVVSEFSYAPAGPRNDAENGYAASDFEFVELLNVSDYTLDAGSVSFSQGIATTLPAGTTIPPGGRLILSPAPEAFAARYGARIPVVATAFSGKLDNSGESLQLVAANGSAILEFAYSPIPPWPSVDGGRSLILVSPSAASNHADPAQWRASDAPDGLPGDDKGDESAGPYDAWKLAEGIAGDDEIRYGLPAIAAWALGASPSLSATDVLPVAGLETAPSGGGTETVLTFSFRVREAATDVDFAIESTASPDAGPWSPADLELVSTTSHGDGTATVVYQSALPPDSDAPRFFRLRIARR